MNQGFAKALVEDYSALGWGTAINEYTLKSETGDEVEFAVVGDDAGNTEAVELYHNGDLIETLHYETTDFAQKLALLVSNLMEPTTSHS